MLTEIGMFALAVPSIIRQTEIKGADTNKIESCMYFLMSNRILCNRFMSLRRAATFP